MNVSPSNFLQKNYACPSLRDFLYAFSSTFIYKAILIEIYMNSNDMKTQIFHKLKYDLRFSFIHFLFQI